MHIIMKALVLTSGGMIKDFITLLAFFYKEWQIGFRMNNHCSKSEACGFISGTFEFQSYVGEN